MLTQRSVDLERMQFKSQKAAAYHCKQPQEKNNVNFAGEKVFEFP